MLEPIIEKAEENLRLAFKKKVQAAAGSDAGAYRVMHGRGIQEEWEAFRRILGDSPSVEEWLCQGEDEIRRRFRRPQS